MHLVPTVQNEPLQERIEEATPEFIRKSITACTKNKLWWEPISLQWMVVPWSSKANAIY